MAKQLIQKVPNADQLQERLAELKREFEAGQAQLQAREQQQMSLRETLLRISGAIQVLEELLAAQTDDQKVPQAEDAGRDQN